MKNTKKRIIYTIVSTFIVVFSTTFAILMTLERADYRNYLQGEYSKNLYELIGSVQNIRTNLGKSNVVGSREQNIMVLEDTFRYATIANDKLHSLPIQQQDINKTSKFLSQVGDFCYYLNKNISEGKELTEKDYQTIDSLEVQSYELEQRLSRVVGDINEGKVKWGEIRKKTSGVLAKSGEENAVAGKFANIQKQVMQYPSLIYDGPFSDNVLAIKPKVYNEAKISVDSAKKIVSKAIGEKRVASIGFQGEETKGKIDSYRFKVNLKGDKNRNVVCEISKNGGKIVYLLDNKNVKSGKISLEEANKKGREFLEKLGYKGLVATYTLKYDDTALINYVYQKGDIMIYPDQIKVKIALDNGDVVGVESEKYLIAHDENRKISKPKITEQDARKRVNKRLEIEKVKLAVIPTETNKEVLCYEIKGKCKGKNYIVYVDAETGYEKKIIEIINTPNGKLTI